jgi:hypothetical protein
MLEAGGAEEIVKARFARIDAVQSAVDRDPPSVNFVSQ